jgi:hypothetical protein
MSEQAAQRPFDIGYVLATTAKHMRKSVDISIRKTVDRIGEFEDGPKGAEVLRTLSALHTMRKQIDEFQAAYSVSANETTQGE